MRIFESKEKIGKSLGGWFCFFLFFEKKNSLPYRETVQIYGALP